jgi:hypothetical protein
MQAVQLLLLSLLLCFRQLADFPNDRDEQENQANFAKIHQQSQHTIHRLGFEASFV